MEALAITQTLHDLEERFVAEPPRMPAGREIAKNHELLWTTVIPWVKEHQALIGKITRGIRPYFPGNAKDVFSLAQLIGFQALQTSARQGRLDLFVPIFCKMFRIALIEQCHGVPIARDVDVESLADPDQSPYFPARWPRHLTPELKDRALARMLPSQVAVWKHYLERWDVAQTKAGNAAALNTTSDDYYLRLRGGINRVARQVCKEQP